MQPISFSRSKCPIVEMTLSVDLCFLMSEYQKNGSFVLLQEVDASSVAIGEVTMLNTLKHYQVRGICICRSGVDSFLIWRLCSLHQTLGSLWGGTVTFHQVSLDCDRRPSKRQEEKDTLAAV